MTAIALDTLCPGCGQMNAQRFYTLQRQPVHVGVTYETPQDAACAPIGDIELAYCSGCGLVFNAAFDPQKLAYAPGYEISLVHSALFRRFLDYVIDRLQARYDLRGKTVLEIGCGAGHFIRRLCERVHCSGIGVDPACPTEGTQLAGDQTLTFIRDYYGEKYADVPCDLVCCLDVFEQIPQPLKFLAALRRTLGDRAIPVYFQSPDREHVFGDGVGWSVYYEQCSHFDKGAIARLFEHAGFRVIEVSRCEVNPQYLQVDAVPAEAREGTGGDAAEVRVLPEALRRFTEAQRRRVETWDRRLREAERLRRRVVLWGSGGKGVNFLNTVSASRVIELVVDINPARQGRWLPRGGQRVVPPDELKRYRPHQVIVSNPLWRGEIETQVRELGLECEVVDA